MEIFFLLFFNILWKTMVSKIPVYLNRIKTNLKLVKSKEVKKKVSAYILYLTLSFLLFCFNV